MFWMMIDDFRQCRAGPTKFTHNFVEGLFCLRRRRNGCDGFHGGVVGGRGGRISVPVAALDVAAVFRAVRLGQSIIQEGVDALGEGIGATDRGILSTRRRRFRQSVRRRERIITVDDAAAPVNISGGRVALTVLQERVGVAIGEYRLLLNPAAVYGGAEVRHRYGRRGIGVGVGRVQVYQFRALVWLRYRGGGRGNGRRCRRRWLSVGARHDT